MKREELEHAIRAVCDVADDTEVYVFGSQAILAEYPDAPSELLLSAEADMVPKNKPELVDRVDYALGELSLFHRTHGFYVHGVSISAASLPRGWQKRAHILQNENTGGGKGICVEAHDLAASKLVAYREKDREFVRTLLAAQLISDVRLMNSLKSLQIEKAERERLVKWVRLTTIELRKSIIA